MASRTKQRTEGLVSAAELGNYSLELLFDMSSVFDDLGGTAVADSASNNVKEIYLMRHAERDDRASEAAGINWV